MKLHSRHALAGLLACLWAPASASAQTTHVITTETALRAAITTAAPGDTIALQSNVTLTSDLPIVTTGVTIDGGGFTLSGADAHRGLVIVQTTESPDALDVTIQNLTIANTVAAGGRGGSGGSGGGGGAGLGGALHIGDGALVTVSNVNIISSQAVGGVGGATTAGAAGGGGGMGGAGGSGGLGMPPSDGGGGGVGNGATGGTGGAGGSGTAVGASPGGGALFPGGSNGGGGSSGEGAGGGGIGGWSGGALAGGAGGFGGGGGGGTTGGAGGFGGGGGGGATAGGSGGYGGGGGGSAGAPGAGGAFGGNGSAAGGGGGAGLGGAVFIGDFGILRVAGSFNIGGSSVAAGAGGQALGSGMFLTGVGYLDVDIAAGLVSTIADDIVDEQGAGVLDGGSWHLQKCGDGTLVLSGNNRYSGGTSVCGGTLQITNERNIGTGEVSINNATLSITGNASFTNDLYISADSAVRVAAGRTAVWHGVIGDWAEEDESLAGALRVGGGGVLELTNSGNFYSAGTIVGGGSTVRVSDDGALGLAAGSVTLGDAAGTGTLSISAGSNFVSSRTIVLAAAGSAIDTQSGATAVLNGLMVGPGGLTKTGLGTLVLNNAASSYAGATHVAAGILRTGAAGLFAPAASLTVSDAAVLDLDGHSQEVGSLSGSGLVSLGTATLTIGAGDATSAFSGGISGAGGLVKTGAGVLTLSGVNSYTGGTVVSDGVLLGTATSLQGNIINNATVAFDQTADGTYSGAMSGSGALVKNGSGRLTLTGANTYSGGTTVAAGALVGSTNSLRGRIANDALVVFDQSFDGTFDGAMSGSGIVQKTGLGSLALTEPLLHTGGTVVTGGRLLGSGTSLRGTILNDAAVSFVVDNDQTFDGLLAGIGAFDKVGIGTLTITGSHAHTGLFNVGAGVLNLDGVLASQLTVAPDAVLRARGTILGSTTVNGSLVVPAPPAAAATLSNVANDEPGAAPLLSIGGDLNLLPGSRLSIPLTFGSMPSVLVGGAANINGAVIDVTPLDPLTQRVTSFMALGAMNGLHLSNSHGSSTNPLYVPVLSPDRNALVVTILNLGVPLSTDVTSPNARSVGGVLDGFKNDPSGDQLTVIRELTGLDDDELDNALRQISGEAHASFLQIGIRDSEATNDLLRRHVSARRREVRPGEDLGATWWSQLGGERTRLKNAAGNRVGAIDLGSGMGGMDYSPSDTWTFGLGGGLAAGSINIADLISSGEIVSPRAFGYAGWRPEGFGGITGGATFARQDMDTTRQIVFQGRLPDELGGDPIGEGINREAQAEEVTLVKDQWTDWDDEHEIKTYSLAYVLGYRRATFTRRGFIESGADSLSLEMPEQTVRLRQVNALLNMWRREGDFRPFGEFLYRREITDGRTTATLEFPDEGDSRFAVDGLPAPKNIVKLEVGATWYTRSYIWRFEYRYRNATGQTTHGGSLHVSF